MPGKQGFWNIYFKYFFRMPCNFYWDFIFIKRSWLKNFCIKRLDAIFGNDGQD